MNYCKILGGIVLLSLLGCSPGNDSSAPASQAPDAAVPQVTSQSSIASSQRAAPSVLPAALPSAASDPAAPTLKAASPVASPPSAAVSSDASVKRDYDITTPIPATGKVTVRDSIRNFDTGRLITACPADSGPYAFAESTHYRIQICSQEYDPWLPKYYIGQAKDGSGELRITSTDPDQARQLIFKNGDYTYILYRDGARPDRMNAYLEVYSPDGRNSAEALWYLYEMTNPP